MGQHRAVVAFRNLFAGAFDGDPERPFELTLEGFIQGRAQFHADSGTGMYEGLDRTLYIDLRQGQLNVEESEGETYILSPGCNPVIGDNFGCLDTMPG